MGADCTMVTVCRGVADWVLWMMRLEPPIEVMVGTVSTLTERRTQTSVKGHVAENQRKEKFVSKKTKTLS